MQTKILLLADASSSHIEKWATSLANKGYMIGLFSLHKPITNWYENKKNITVLYQPPGFTDPSSLKTKLQYLLKIPLLYKKIDEFKPDILHAHYATSYGLLGFLSGFRPFILSVWGSDVFEFPNKSFFHRLLFKVNINHVDKLLSTSYAMKTELEKYSKNEVDITYFGVDTSLFYPKEVKTESEKQILHFGIVKSLEEKYGINVIIDAVQLLKLEFPKFKFKVVLVGGGSQYNYYKQKITELGLKDLIVLTGKVSVSEVPYYHNLLDIYLNVSNVNESFGVSVIEAMACGKPAIVTNAVGLVEIVKKDTGFIINMNNPFELATTIKLLMNDPLLRAHMGVAGRKYVKSNYELENCVNKMTDIYEDILGQSFERRFRFKLLNAVFT